MADLANKGYHLYMDNFYNSVQLSMDLLTLKTHTCGTMRRNRGEPKATDVTKAELGHHERVMRHNNTVLIQSWHDRKLVKVISTFHNDDLRTVMEKEKGGRVPVETERPVAVCDYNSYMKGKETGSQGIFCNVVSVKRINM